MGLRQLQVAEEEWLNHLRCLETWETKASASSPRYMVLILEAESKEHPWDKDRWRSSWSGQDQRVLNLRVKMRRLWQAWMRFNLRALAIRLGNLYKASASMVSDKAKDSRESRPLLRNWDSSNSWPINKRAPTTVETTITRLKNLHPHSQHQNQTKLAMLSLSFRSQPRVVLPLTILIKQIKMPT